MNFSLSLIPIIFFCAIGTQENTLKNTRWHVISIYEKASGSLTLNNGQFPEECELNFHQNEVNVNTCNGFTLSFKVKKNKIDFTGGPPGLQASYCGNGFSNKVE